MRYLEIKNIGPLEKVVVELDKLNLFIGPQSGGKSTITKIACYCSWIEKKIALLKSNQDNFSKKESFANELVRFHKLTGYLQEDSYIKYESDILKIEYRHRDRTPEFTWKNRFDYVKGKISYMPAERNIVGTVPNWLELKLEDNNIRNFMVDFEEARKVHPKESPLPIINTGVSYYFDSGKDFIRLNSGKTLELTNASSGLQSMVPLFVHLDYIYDWIYHNEKPESVNDINERSAVDKDLLKGILGFSEQKQLSDMVKEIQSGKATSTTIEHHARFETIQHNFKEIHTTSVYLEEPEQNLFPETQCKLMGELVRLSNLNDSHSLTITTHSPYILSAINNLIYAQSIGEQEREKANVIIPEHSWIAYDRVKAYFVDNGTVRPIMDDDIRQIRAEDIDGASNVINREYEDLSDINN